MPPDDDEDCEHRWVLRGVLLENEGAAQRYGCALCGGLLVVEPGGAEPVEC